MFHYNTPTLNINSPLDQFEIREFISIKAPILLDVQFSLTNIGMYLSLGTFIIILVNILATGGHKVIVPNY
jgi:F-type H+-transporting ATPase subunit a